VNNNLNFFKISKFFLYLAPFSTAIVTASTLFPFIVGKYVFFRAAVDLALIFFLLGLLLQDKLSVMGSRLSAKLKSPLVIAVSIFVLIFILSGFFGVNPSNSFWSNFERGEGGIQIIHLYVFFLLLAVVFREEKDWLKLFWVLIAAAALMILYGAAAGLKMSGFIGGAFGGSGFRFSGSIGNPAYVATYLVFSLFYACYLLFGADRRESDKNSRGIIFYWEKLKTLKGIILMFFMILFFVFFWLAATRGAFVGLLAAIVAGTAYFVYGRKNLRKWFFGGVVVLLLAVGTMVYFKDTAFVKSIPGSRVFDISFSAQTWQHRTYMWKIAYDGFKERPLLGWGPENFINIFDRHFNVQYFNPTEGFGAWFDRAHSIYFDYLAETGILGLSSYLGIFAVFYWQLFKRRDDQRRQSALQNALIFAIPVAYLVQGIVLFDVLPTYLNVFSVLAFASYKFQKMD